MHSIFYLFCLGCCVFLTLCSCQEAGDGQKLHDAKNAEASADERDDSLALLDAYNAQAKIPNQLLAKVETEAARAKAEEDAADDPAIWVHRKAPDKSLVFGSNKQGGLAAYDLSGQEIMYYDIGNINNVDVLYDFPIGEERRDILGCSNRSDQSINLFQISMMDGDLTDIAADTFHTDHTIIDDIYGFCFAHDREAEEYYAIINGKNGMMQQYRMLMTEEGINLNLARSIQFPSKTEGMVADNLHGYLYVAEEDAGIWKLPINPSDTNKMLIPKSNATANPNIKHDIEGLTLYAMDSTGYLIASSQGNFSYAVFERAATNTYLGSFAIKDSDNGIDGVQETDGIDASSLFLNSDFPQGMLVVQDGYNYYRGDSLLPQNFKYVDARQLINLVQRMVE